MKILSLLLMIIPIGGCDLFKSSIPSNESIQTFSLPKDPAWVKNEPPADAFTNKAVIVNFWASWCAPCQEEMPSLLKLTSERSTEIALVAISGDNSQIEMKKFMSLFPNFKGDSVFVVHDVSRNWIQKYSVSGFPETFVYDGNHNLVKKYQGAVDFKGEEFLQILNKISKK